MCSSSFLCDILYTEKVSYPKKKKKKKPRYRTGTKYKKIVKHFEHVHT